MKIKYLLPAVFLVVIISGCAQISDYTTAYDRFQKLKDTTGYSIEYAPEISFEFSQKTKEFMEKSGSGTIPSLSLPPFLLTQKQAQKGKLLRSSLDLSGLISALSTHGEQVAAQQGKVLTESEKAALTQAFKLKGFSFYDLEDKGAVCLDLKDKSVCVQAGQKEVYEKVGALKQQIEAIRGQFNQDPNQILTTFNNLLQKGALNIQSVSGSTVALRGCTKVAYTVALENLTAGEMADFSKLIGFGGQSAPDETSDDPIMAQQKEQMKALLKQMIKELRQEVCLDNEHGAVLSYDFKMSIDMAPMMKMFAGLIPEEGKNKVPEEMAFSFKIRFAAIDFKPYTTDFDFAFPSGSQIWTIDDLLKLFPSSGLSGFGGTPTSPSTEDASDISDRLNSLDKELDKKKSGGGVPTEEKTKSKPIEIKTVKINGDFIFPRLVFNGELYGSGSNNIGKEYGTYKLVKNKWEKVYAENGKREIDPIIVFNGDLYGKEIAIYKLVNNKWELAWDVDIVPSLVYNEELYGYSYRDSTVDPRRGTYKLVGDNWKRVGAEEVFAKAVVGDTLYGMGPDGVFRLVKGEWEKVGMLSPESISEFNGELYAAHAGYGSQEQGTFKLTGNDWTKINDDFMMDMIKLNGQLYSRGLGRVYKLVGNEWVEIVDEREESIEPLVAFNGELYGLDVSGLYKITESDGSPKEVGGDDWAKVGSVYVTPSVVFNGELYGGHGSTRLY